MPSTTHSSPPEKEPKAFAISIVAALGFGLSSGTIYSINQLFQVSRPNIHTYTEAQVKRVSPSFTLLDYSRMKIGMNLAEVELILNPGIEESQSDSASTFVWKNTDGSYIRLFFKNGLLASKQQKDLMGYCNNP
ncbi:MAG: hypothetical protein AAFQ63_18145 [Cyanobacteria bacterium J06621_11]